MSQLEDTKQALLEIQQFDCESLEREEELGKSLNFSEAVKPAEKLVSFYNQLSTSVLEDFPINDLTIIQRRVNSDLADLKAIFAFNPSNIQNPGSQRDTLVNKLKKAYDITFKDIASSITYGVSRTVDFQRLENEGKAALATIKKAAETLHENLESQNIEAEQILANVKKVAAEQGVSQQAIYFKEESDNHDKQAAIWKTRVNRLSVILGIYALISLFLHKCMWLSPKNNIESFQLISSKVLVFAVIGYMLLHSARNFLSHKHNSAVNKHRQNALLTFNSLVDAATSTDAKDVILNHAASCIFTPQETGFLKNQKPSSQSVVGLMPKTLMKINE